MTERRLLLILLVLISVTTLIAAGTRQYGVAIVGGLVIIATGLALNAS